MKPLAAIPFIAALLLAPFAPTAVGQSVPQFVDLFNGKDLTGWVNVNTAPDTWKVQDGLLICSGHPIGVMRSEKQYENYILHIEWMHMEPGGNSGVFRLEQRRCPTARAVCRTASKCRCSNSNGPICNKVNGVTPPIAYVHGELFGVGGVKTVPDNPRGERSKSIENRCKGKGEWNTYDVVAVDGVIKLAVNGKFVNGIAEIHPEEGLSLSGVGRR